MILQNKQGSSLMFYRKLVIGYYFTLHTDQCHHRCLLSKSQRREWSHWFEILSTATVLTCSMVVWKTQNLHSHKGRQDESHPSLGLWHELGTWGFWFHLYWDKIPANVWEKIFEISLSFTKYVILCLKWLFTNTELITSSTIVNKILGNHSASWYMNMQLIHVITQKQELTGW